MVSIGLSNKEIEKLEKLGDDIQKDLSCDANGIGIPCRTDRLSAVENMKRYLEIHNYDVIAPGLYEGDKNE
tara:strand:- start:181 stop:393 length:213 start_codon:yes stop_codon:yes gene_type:complete